MLHQGKELFPARAYRFEIPDQIDFDSRGIEAREEIKQSIAFRGIAVNDLTGELAFQVDWNALCTGEVIYACQCRWTRMAGGDVDWLYNLVEDDELVDMKA